MSTNEPTSATPPAAPTAGPARPRPAARPGTRTSSAASSRNSQPGNSANSGAGTAPASTLSPTSPRSSPSPAPRSTAPFNEGSAIQAAPVWTARRQARLARSATLVLDLGQLGVADFSGLLATDNGGSPSGLPGGRAPLPVARWRAPGRGAAAAARPSVAAEAASMDHKVTDRGASRRAASGKTMHHEHPQRGGRRRRGQPGRLRDLSGACRGRAPAVPPQGPQVRAGVRHRAEGARAAGRGRP